MTGNGMFRRLGMENFDQILERQLKGVLICGNKMPARCNRGFYCKSQHVSGTTMTIIRSSRVLYSGCCLWYFVLWFSSCWYGVRNRGADKSLARPTSRCILFDGENISFDASLVIYINSTNIPPIMIINRIYET